MAILSVNELPNGRGGDAEAAKGSETRVFRVVCSSPYDTMTTIAASNLLPRYLEPHPNNIFLRNKKISVRQEHGRTIWLATCSYDNEPLTQDERDRNIEDPTQRPAKISLQSNRFTKPVDKDYQGKAIVNSAGKYYDPPPEIDSVTRTLVIKKNVAQIPLWLLDFEDSVNESPVVIAGIEIPKRCGKIGPIPISEEVEENQVKYRVLELQIDITKPPEVQPRQVLDGITRETTSDIGGWDLLLLNQGLQERVVDSTEEPAEPPEWRNILIDGEPANSPQLLDDRGLLLSVSDPGEMFFNRHLPYYPRDWSQISSIWS